ncbi:hypothetical protein [Luteipulveratus flavus]|uniref:VWA domain-containing protein n=1 Tax=Luteipulveratus flavus TaxID=3031728 RepID=A0ABT6C6W1_9MICO|nr:hypothetical protein [Luteipulveratus sp. YIM 133296]MDF8264679.1 hypothetical protein [Luteipulveratus sp. YIM 133296]
MTDPLDERWAAAWPEALSCWGQALRLSEPLLLTDEATQPVDALAWFSLDDVRATIDLRRVVALGIQDDPLPVLAHEIGHHVLAPADLTGLARTVQRCRLGLVDRDGRAAEMANLWTDLLINDRLTRQCGLDMTGPYRAAAAGASVPYFTVYLRTCEVLWQLPRRTLTSGPVSAQQDTDAALLARHARVFAREFVEGAGGFAALMRRWMPEDDAGVDVCRVHVDGDEAPELDDGDLAGGVPLHPALDPRVNPEAGRAEGSGGGGGSAGGDDDGSQEAAPSAGDDSDQRARTGRGSGGQSFGPSDLAVLYGAMDLRRDAALDWYVRRASRHLVPFPRQARPPAAEPEWQGMQTWDLGDDPADIDWAATMLRSTTVVPGVTTQRRVVERASGPERERRPVDLDLYVDSSGSMPDPRRSVSPAVLGGAVLVLSALRVGARVRVTSWAGPEQISSTGDFVRDRTAAVLALLTYHGGGTSFPLAQLAHAHRSRGRSPQTREQTCHIAVISDDGVRSMFGQGQPRELAGAAHEALAAAGGGGTLVLDVPESVVDDTRELAGDYEVVRLPPDDLVAFARVMARRSWGGAAA